MKKIEAVLLRVLEALTALALLAIALTVVLQVMLNFCFNSSITGANEIITKLFVYLSALGSAVVVGRQEHIAITFAKDDLPPSARRLVDVMSLLAVALLNAVVVVYSFHWISVTGHFLMPTTQLPRVVAQLSVPLGAGVSLLFCLLRLRCLLKHDTARATEVRAQ